MANLRAAFPNGTLAEWIAQPDGTWVDRQTGAIRDNAP